MEIIYGKRPKSLAPVLTKTLTIRITPELHHRLRFHPNVNFAEICRRTIEQAVDQLEADRAEEV